MVEMNKEQLKMIQLMMNLKEAFEELDKFTLENQGLSEHLSYQYPFVNDDCLTAVTEKVGEWVDETIYNVQKGIKG